MRNFNTLSKSLVFFVETLQLKLWELVNSSSSYNFLKEPLPVFYVLLSRYCNQDITITDDGVSHYVSNLSFDFSTDRGELLNEFPKSCENVLVREKEIFNRFFELITDGYDGGSDEESTGVITHGVYKYIHKELIEFFIRKYSEFSQLGSICSDDIFDVLYSYCRDDNEDDYHESRPIYVPYSGLSSYFLHAEEDFSFMSHCYNEEPNENLAIMAKVRLNAWGYPSKIVSQTNPTEFTFNDPLKKWDWAKGWAMVSIPPLGLKVKQIGENDCIREFDVAEFLISRFLVNDNIHTAYLVLPLSFCYSSSFEHLRKDIVDRKFLREVIEIPAKYFKTTSIATVMIKLDKYGKDSVNFGELDKKNDIGYVDTVKVNNNSIMDNDYLIVPSLYVNNELELKNGQVSMNLSDVVDVSEPIKLTSSEEIFVLNDTDFISSTDELFAERTLQLGSPLDNMKLYSGKCIVLKKRLNGIAVCPIDGTFAASTDCIILNLKKDVVMLLNYLAYAILDSEKIRTISSYGIKLSGTIIQLMLNVKLPVYTIQNMQEALMITLKDQYIQRKESEFRTEMERYGIRAASSDLNHLLGPTYLQINSTLNQLENCGLELALVESVRNNVAYMSRMIKHTGIDFNSYKPILKEVEICKFFQEHIKVCKNLYRTSFQINYVNTIDKNSTFCVDEDMFRYLIDTILDNVYRHGFEQREVLGSMVYISTTPKLIDDNPYLLLSIANNGKPLAEDFSIEKFIGRGKCCGDTKHTGLGGYHIYHIIKSHNGYLNITGTSVWPVIYEILIPIEDSFEDNAKLSNYENRANFI